MKMKNVIHIYGASGSGTSTLGRKISEELGYKFMDTDDYFWLPTNPKYITKRIKQRERDKFGERIAPGGDMYHQHLDFIEWARKYDTGSVYMLSKAKHDEWQKLLQCKQLILNGADDLDKNFEEVRTEINSVIGRTVTVTIDRPLGSYHTKHKKG